MDTTQIQDSQRAVERTCAQSERQTCDVSAPRADGGTRSLTRAAIVVLSDPNGGTEESLGRVFNALAAAYDFAARGAEVTILFQGAGTRWPARLADPAHPAHALYEAVADRVAGVSCGCAEVFGATEGAERSGMDLIRGNPVPGTSGLPSLQSLMADGYAVLTF